MELTADCARCVGLCCIAPEFAISADFALAKPAGAPCPNLRPDCRCAIHPRLRAEGFRGCAVFDCFGAGQRVVQTTFGGRHWRDEPAMLEVFGVMRALHELLWYLTEALELETSAPIDGELRAALGDVERLTCAGPGELVRLDVGEQRTRVDALLRRASELARAGRAGPNREGADLMGADLRTTGLAGASLRGSYLIGADLRDVDLRAADMLGADLRDADVRGADLRDCVFLTQSQLDAARGDAATLLPASLRRPAHW